MALAVLAVLLAGQVHLWTETGAARLAGHEHRCQACLSGGWAIVAAGPSLPLALRSFPLEPESSRPAAKTHRARASVPRAPPLA